KSHYAMLNLKQLSYYTDSIVQFNDSLRTTVLPEIIHYYPILNRPNIQNLNTLIAEPYNESFLTVIPEDAKESVLNQAMNEVRYIQDIVSMRATTDADYTTTIRRYIMEYQRKFTLSVACLLLFSI